MIITIQIILTGMRKSVINILLIFFLMIGCASGLAGKDCYEQMEVLYRQYKTGFPNVPDMSAEELVERQKREGVVIVDNREPAEREVSIIPDAITKKEFLNNIEDYDDTLVVVYCTIGSRSGLFAKKLRKKKINAYNLKGGILAWAHAGKTFVDNQGNKTKQVHVYGPDWDLLPMDYEAVW